jgi:hypothetical protein
MELGSQSDDRSRYSSPEELRYARVLQIGTRVGFVTLIVTFALYVSGALAPLVPIGDLPKYWGLSARAFVAATHQPTGWSWLKELAMADIVNLAPIAFLAGVSALCSLAVLPQFVRRRDTVHAMILVLQIVVLMLAASNIFAA